MIQELFDLMRKIGIDNVGFDENLPLETYIKESYKYVKFLAEIEKKYDIELPESIMLEDKITISQVADLIRRIMEENK